MLDMVDKPNISIAILSQPLGVLSYQTYNLQRQILHVRTLKFVG